MSRTPRPRPLQTRLKHWFYAVMSFAFSQGRGYRDGFQSHAVIRNSAAGRQKRSWNDPAVASGSTNGLERDCLGVVIHAFYPDLLAEIVEHLNHLPHDLHLYVTTPPENAATVPACLASSHHPHTLMYCENRGKDILPFLKVAPLLIENGHDCFLKIHTKKSPHRRYGFFWRNDIYSKLMTPRAVKSALDTFNKDPGVGIIAPKDHLVPMTHYSKSIEKRLLQLAAQVGVSKEVTLKLRFAAGTMFFARTECILPLLDLSLDDDAFEYEHGQIDGTLAHAMERLFAVAAEAVSLDVIDTGFAHRVTETGPKIRRQGPDEANAVGSGTRNG